MDQELKDTVHAEVERKVAALFREDASLHRSFLESMFTKVMWGLGVLVVVILGAGAWLFGQSVESASKTQIQAFLKEETVRKALRDDIDELMNEVRPQLQAQVDEDVQKTLAKQSGAQLEKAVTAKIEEIKRLKPTDLFQAGLKGDRGPQGPQGPPGLEGRKGDRGDSGLRGQDGMPWVPRISFPPTVEISGEAKSKRAPLGQHLVCFLSGLEWTSEEEACSCMTIKDNSGAWVLDIKINERKSGRCLCSTVCLD